MVDCRYFKPGVLSNQRKEIEMENYVEFFETQDEAIAHCRERNRGLSSTDPNCYAVVDGPGCQAWEEENHPDNCTCCAYAVVDLETARDLLDFPASGLAPLVVTN